MNGPDDKNGGKSLALSTPPKDELFVLETQLRECFGRCAYAHKTHEKMAERLSLFSGRIKWGQIVLSALTTAGIVGVFFSQGSLPFTASTAFVSFLNLILSTYAKDEDTGELAQKHREIASDIWNAREDYLSLLTDARDPAFSMDELRKRRDSLQANLHRIYRRAPHTNSGAYAKAQDALKNKGDLSFSDEEIDALLPTPLKRDSSGCREHSDSQG